MPGRVQPRAVQGQQLLAAEVGVAQIQLDGRMVIAPALRWRRASGLGAAAALGMLGAGGAAEELLEEVAEFGAVQALGAGCAGELETGVPVGRRAEVLTRVVRGLLPQAVVGSALFGVGQDGVGLVHLGHAGRGVSLLADVGVVAARQLAVGLLDVVRTGIARHAQDLVVVLELHASSMLGMGRGWRLCGHRSRGGVVFTIVFVACSAYWVCAIGNFVSNFARCVAKKTLTLRTFASWVNRRCDRAR